MKRSTGITASAVVAFIGSIGAVLMGALIILASILASSTFKQNPTSGVSPEAAVMNLAGFAVMYVGFGVWGIVSAIGLLRLRNWARICFAVFGGILAIFSLFVVLGILLVIPASSRMQPANAGSSPDVFIALIFFFVACALACAALGIWWAVYFNRKHVRVQFVGEESAAVNSRLPLSISILSWILIVSGTVLLPRVLAPSPLMIFSFVAYGSSATVMYFLLAAVSLASGIGMLKKVEAAHSLALINCVYGLVNTLAAFLIPGSSGRRQQFIEQVQGTSPMILPMNTILTFSLVFGFVSAGIGFWFLMTRRNAFLEVAREKFR